MHTVGELQAKQPSLQGRQEAPLGYWPMVQRTQVVASEHIWQFMIRDEHSAHSVSELLRAKLVMHLPHVVVLTHSSQPGIDELQVRQLPPMRR